MLGSLAAIGIGIPLLQPTSVSSRMTGKADARRLGALAGKCWCDGMEVEPSSPISEKVVRQIECAPVAGSKLTIRSRARCADVCPGVDNVYDLNFNGRERALKR